MIMEMRVYRCLPGRLPALMKRFDTLTLHRRDRSGDHKATEGGELLNWRRSREANQTT